MSDRPCGHWLGSRFCGAVPSRQYTSGDACAAHTPAALAGRPDHVPDEALTMEALMTAAGRPPSYVASGSMMNGSSLNDQRAIASGRRRSSPQAFRDARAAEDERRRRGKILGSG